MYTHTHTHLYSSVHINIFVHAHTHTPIFINTHTCIHSLFYHPRICVWIYTRVYLYTWRVTNCTYQRVTYLHMTTLVFACESTHMYTYIRNESRTIHINESHIYTWPPSYLQHQRVIEEVCTRVYISIQFIFTHTHTQTCIHQQSSHHLQYRCVIYVYTHILHSDAGDGTKVVW